jgi:hypothetical protein
MISGIEVAKVAGTNIGAAGAMLSTSPINMLKDATKGNVKIADKNVKQKFVVVGFQDSYGKAQG